MATIGTSALTLGDIAKRMDGDLDKIAAVVEVLSSQNDILTVLPYKEGNTTTGHRTTLRSGLPTVGTRRINQGVTPSKSTTKQVDESVMLLESYSEIDVETLRLGGKESEIRASEDVAAIEAMNQYVATSLFYGNPANDIDSFLGLTPRYASLSGEHGNQIFDAGGAGTDNTSVWLVGMGDKGLHGIYPKGTKAGIERVDLGEQYIQENGTRRTAKVTKFVWHNGIAVKDYRHIMRIANIDVSNLETFGSSSDTSANLLRFMIKALNRVPGNPESKSYGLKYFFLVNETTKTWADIMRTEKANGAFGLKEIDGIEFTTFRGVPVLKCDAITVAESQVS